MGAPTKYNPIVQIPFLLELFKQGHHIAHFCADVGITRHTFQEWCKEYKEFNEAFEKGNELSRKWWEHAAWDNLILDKNMKFNSQIWHIMMRNRFQFAGDRLVPIKGWSRIKTLDGKIDRVSKELENGSITFAEAVSLLSGVNIEANILEKCELIKRLESIEKRLSNES